MIIVDLQQVMIASIMMQMGNSGGEIEVPMFKHMVLNSLRSYRMKFGAKYGELVIATDTGSSWRRTIFPYYKANRKKDRDESKLDWESILAALKEIKAELKEFFPYRVISVEGAEADDVIATLCHEFGSPLPGADPILILSGDKDFKQLQMYMNVEQYDPVRKKSLSESNPSNYLYEHIIKGDRGDGVPNILSADNCLVLGVRQGTMTSKRLESFKQSIKTDSWESSEVKRNYLRNKSVIDLWQIPDGIRADIIDEYHSESGKGRDHIFNYFIKNRMKHLMEFVNEF